MISIVFVRPGCDSQNYLVVIKLRKMPSIDSMIFCCLSMDSRDIIPLNIESLISRYWKFFAKICALIENSFREDNSNLLGRNFKYKV